ncbi:MAG: cold shock domain-containing protein [Ilumatobacteraceae bacterium]
MRLDGTVSAFDHHEGLGWIDDAAGGRYLFHCAELLDGSRDVAVGARVTFERAIRFGHQEAARIEKR